MKLYDRDRISGRLLRLADKVFMIIVLEIMEGATFKSTGISQNPEEPERGSVPRTAITETCLFVSNKVYHRE